ncbi:Acyl-CoA reductase [Pseudonocardia thermophila]|uniref:Acyl-CoA reductase n=1 Tax=Pseudonocardia thermophila TaxID=1848 RepID=A0A1M6PPB7_PSETH|nr:aldehyde dehydrogenase family protein [Pseudonocardia thermophila]SHK09678.1 Acyl-CoA reductase [Pseudonocardia thermophila]
MTVLPRPEVSAPQMSIDGEPVSTPSRIEVVDPATAAPFVAVPDAGPEHVSRAVAAAQRAGRVWRALSVEERQKYLLQVVAILRNHLDELASLVTAEQGKPLGRARSEIESGLRYCEAHAQFRIPTELVRDDDEETVVVNRVPLAVTAAITAWNYPVLLMLRKIAPALVAGSTLIVKPSPYTPVATLRAGELLQEVLPAGVVQVLSGGDELGRALVSHPGIGKISFTGSVATGRAIMAAAAPTLKRLTLELGGNDAAIVLDDVDPAEIAADLYWGGLSNCGQVCAAIKRLFVPESLAEDLASALADVAASVVVGDGFADGVDMGPLQNRPQLDLVRSLVADAEQHGAEVYFRGEAPDGPGFFHPVTLVRRVRDDLPLARQEQFGPVLPLFTYSDLDEAIERANASEFGLGASVWAADEERAVAVAGRLEAGTVWVNQHPMLSADTPFGGIKQSGLGVEGSVHGVLGHTDICVLRVKH